MTKDLKPIIEKPSIGDIGYQLISIGLTLIPYGSPIASLFTAVIVPPSQKRSEKLLSTLAEDLTKLKEEFDYKFENLSEKPMFVTALMQGLQIAIRNHQDEKIDALKNAILNSALKNSPEDDLQLIFLNYIDTFTVLHIKLLEFFNKPLSKDLISELKDNFKFEAHELEDMDIIEFNLGEVLEYIFPDLKGQDHIYKNIARDLNTKGLIIILEPVVGFSVDINIKDGSMADPHIQSLGKMFLSYINPPKQLR